MEIDYNKFKELIIKENKFTKGKIFRILKECEVSINNNGM